MLRATPRFEQSRGEDRDRLYRSPKPRRNGYGCRQKHRTTAAAAWEGDPELAAPAAGIEPSSNLERFLVVATPSVAVQYLSKTTMSWSTCNVEYHPYFTFADLWESFKEPSVYGAGVPLVLDEGDCVVQYSVPYLSGIQLFGEHRRPAVNSRRPVVDSDVDSFRDSSSDDSSDSDGEAPTKYPKELSWCHPFSTAFLGSDGRSFEKNTALSEGFSSDDSEAGTTRGHLLFQFFEHDVPCSRVPLADKVLMGPWAQLSRSLMDMTGTQELLFPVLVWPLTNSRARRGYRTPSSNKKFPTLFSRLPITGCGCFRCITLITCSLFRMAHFAHETGWLSLFLITRAIRSMNAKKEPGSSRENHRLAV